MNNLRRHISTGNVISSMFKIPVDNYLTIEALEDGLTAKISSSKSCEYCIDGDDDWKVLSSNSITATINRGQTLSFRGNLTPTSSNGIGTFTVSKKYNLRGNCMSLLYGDDAINKSSVPQNAFRNLFKSSTTVINASKLKLPATVLSGYCYDSMFRGCTNLVSAPKLLATTLSDYCYQHMFRDCSSLVEVQEELPAVNMKNYCYANMFQNCTSLRTMLRLPAIKLKQYSYHAMFINTAIEEVSSLPATTLDVACYKQMFENCKKLKYVKELPATTLCDDCYWSMFNNCASLIEVPVLPALKLFTRSYQYMFSNCGKLDRIAMLATSVSASACLNGWVSGVSTNGTFIKNPNMNSLSRGTSGIPSNWVVEDYVTVIDCASLEITADNVNGRSTTTTIYYTAVLNAIDFNNNPVSLTRTGTAISDSFPQNTSTTDTVERVITFTYMGITATTTIIQGVWVNQSYEIDLNNNWQLSSKPNPDLSQYDGVYESFSNKGIDNTAAVMYINIVGYSNFDLYIRSYAESNYDYVMVSQLDQVINNSTSYSNTTLVKAHTKGKSTSMTELSNHTLVQFTNIDGGEHRITIVYRKDSSSHSGDDRGYVLIKK